MDLGEKPQNPNPEPAQDFPSKSCSGRNIYISDKPGQGEIDSDPRETTPTFHEPMEAEAPRSRGESAQTPQTPTQSNNAALIIHARFYADNQHYVN